MDRFRDVGLVVHGSAADLPQNIASTHASAIGRRFGRHFEHRQPFLGLDATHIDAEIAWHDTRGRAAASHLGGDRLIHRLVVG